MTCVECVSCAEKDREIKYLKALLALDGIEESASPAARTDLVDVKQRYVLLRQQLALIRADVQYMNKQVQSVLQWISNVLTVLLSCCGRIGELTAASVVESVTHVTKVKYYHLGISYGKLPVVQSLFTETSEA